MRSSFSPSRTALAGKIFALAAIAGAMFSASACSSDTTGGADSGATGTGGNSSSGGSAGNSSTGGSSGTGASGGGGSSGACTGAPATGMNDATHCVGDAGGAITQATGKCATDAASADAGAPDYGDTLYGDEGFDDDCKYHVKMSVAPICENAGVTFTVTVTNTADGKPTTGAYPYVELTLDGLPPGPNPKFVQKYTEKAGGVYDVGPVAFDKPGKWTARFHFFENCSDTPDDSPHGHIAFYINVP